MKKIVFYVTTALAFTLVLSGCKKGLDQTSYGILSPVNFPKTEGEFELYTLEVYKPFGSKWGYADPSGAYQFLFHGVEYSNIQLNDATSDITTPFVEWGGFWELLSKADFVYLKNQNRSAHFEKVRFVTRMTKIIDDLEKATTISDAKKKQLLGEARLGRGLLMYYLLTMYGPVPVILDAAKIGTDAEADLTRPDRASYVSSIAQDLRYAGDNLTKSPAEYGRFNKGLALTTLLRLHLFEKDYVKAEQVGREVLTLGYTLSTNYMDLFRTATEKNNETIWAVSVDPTGDGTEPKPNFNPWVYYTYPNGYPGNAGNQNKGGWAWPNAAIMATWDFYESFAANDKRRELLVASYAPYWGGAVVNKASGLRGAVIAKYQDVDKTLYQGNDIVVARYADVLLMLAEAINQNSGPTSEAQGFVNQVRGRAGIGDLPTADVASKDAFANAIVRERAWELYFEGFRRVDLMRFGKWNTALQAAGKNPNPAGANGYFPIPQYALDAGKGQLQQNAGY
jgi:hypothetical protein